MSLDIFLNVSKKQACKRTWARHKTEMALAALITPPDVLDFGKPRGDLIGGGVGNRLIRQQSRDFRDHVVTMRARCDRAGDGASDRSVDDMYVVTRSKQRSQQVDSLLTNGREIVKKTHLLCSHLGSK